MNVNRGKMTAAAVLAVTLLVVGGVTGYGLHRAGTVGQPFVEDGRLKVMASFYPMYDFARKVGGDRIQVKDMVPAGTEPHDWEPAATDIRNLEDADVFVYNGADLEHWAEDVLDTLEKYDAVATFFVVGNRVPAYPSYVKRAYSLGCEIGTHTYDHAWLNQLSAAGIKDEIKKGSDAIVRAIGVAPTLMRPPGGCINETVRKNVGLPMILWSVDTRDWETRSTPTTITRVVDGAYDGAVILVHDLHESTAIASKTFIPRLIENGYQLVTVSEMAELRGITMKAGETYNSFR